MNIAIVLYTLGSVMEITGGLLLLPVIVALIYHESTLGVFLLTAAGSFAAGWLLRLRRPNNTVFYLKEGFVTTALSWVVISFIGCLPFYFTGVIPSFTNALFETVSGFTTTGASILYDVEVLPVSCLFWRSFSHWIGGMGVLVFLLAIIPISGGSQMNLMKAESPGPSVGKFVPKVMATARILYLIYFVMSLVELVFLLIGRMPFLEALMITFGTAGTGGFGVRNSSIGGYSAYIQWVVAIFMLLFGMNFNFYYFILLKRAKAAFKMEEIRAYLAMVAAACVMIFINLQHQMQGMEGILRHTFFQVASLTTSTGFATVDFDRWPGFSKMVLIFLMFVGACAGSTGGGLKVQRILILMKSFTRQMRIFVHPRSVRRIKYDGKSISDEMASSVQTYLIAFLIVFGVSLMLISIEGKDAVTNFTSVLTTINNMGPGLNLVGPSKNFEHMSILSKYVLMFDMLAGRLELYPLLMLMNPLLWKETAQKQARIRRRFDR